MKFRQGDKVVLRPELRDSLQYSHWSERHETFTVSRISDDKMWFKDIGGWLPLSDMCLAEPRNKTRSVLDILNS
jgi:hypothetical protein